jgi:hypothetical protein
MTPKKKPDVSEKAQDVRLYAQQAERKKYKEEKKKKKDARLMEAEDALLCLCCVSNMPLLYLYKGRA